MSQTGCSAANSEPYALRVIGNSMAPEFMDGNIIIVDPAFPPKDGVYAVIELHREAGNEVIFGQICRDNSGVSIRFLNPEFPPIDLSDEYLIKGVVTQKNGRRRRDIKHYDY